jgi:hypothetical protein
VFILAQRSLSIHFSLTQIDLSEHVKESRRFLVVINAPLTDAVSWLTSGERQNSWFCRIGMLKRVHLAMILPASFFPRVTLVGCHV